MENNTNKEQIFHNLPASSSFPLYVFILFIVVVMLGVGSGYMLARHTAGSAIQSGSTTNSNGSSGVVAGTIYGSGDTNTFKDTAEGVVQKGGIGDEGQFHLVRPGGESQYVYMTSSLVDLSQFIGHKVKVWGQTQKAQQAGWLMDVGRVEVEQ